MVFRPILGALWAPKINKKAYKIWTIFSLIFLTIFGSKNGQNGSLGGAKKGSRKGQKRRRSREPQIGAKKGPKWSPKGAKMEPKWSPKGSKMEWKWRQNRLKMKEKWSPLGSELKQLLLYISNNFLWIFTRICIEIPRIFNEVSFDFQSFIRPCLLREAPCKCKMLERTERNTFLGISPLNALLRSLQFERYLSNALPVLR